MNSLSLSSALNQGLQVTFIGFVIVFSVLIVLMLVMILMKKIFIKNPTTDKSTVKIGSGITIKSKSGKDLSKDPNLPVVIAAAVAASDDTAVIAAITAAIAAYTEVPICNLRIKSYRRIGGSMPAWKQAGLRETMDSKLN